MPRALFALLLFALSLLAAPVPKGIKAKAPPLVGTTWVGENASDVGRVTYSFEEGGRLVCSKNGQPYTKNATNTWAQDGDTLTWSVNGGYATATLTRTDGGYEGTATNVKGKTWAVKLSPTEK